MRSPIDPELARAGRKERISTKLIYTHNVRAGYPTAETPLYKKACQMVKLRGPRFARI